MTNHYEEITWGQAANLNVPPYEQEEKGSNVVYLKTEGQSFMSDTEKKEQEELLKFRDKFKAVPFSEEGED